jgi:hypothetical protein
MEAHRFDCLARSLGRAAMRRRLLIGLALSPLAGLVAIQNSEDVEARKRRKKKRKPRKKPRTPAAPMVPGPVTRRRRESARKVPPRQSSATAEVAGVCAPRPEAPSAGTRGLQVTARTAKRTLTAKCWASLLDRPASCTQGPIARAVVRAPWPAWRHVTSSPPSPRSSEPNRIARSAVKQSWQERIGPLLQTWTRRRSDAGRRDSIRNGSSTI